MKILELLSHDKSLELVSGDENNNVETISTLDWFCPSSLIFLGNSKYLKSYEESAKRDGTESLVLDRKLYDSLSPAEVEGIKTQAENILISSNIPLSISFLSRPFYNKKVGSLNFQVDGRKLGTVKIHPSARIAENVFIGDNVEIGENTLVMPGATIMPNVKIGNDCTLYPSVNIYPFVEIGNCCRIHASVVIGSDGFGYNYSDGDHHKIWHFGGVKIGDMVEIGPSCCIDGGTFSPTIIESKTKLDNLVHIAHNVRLSSGVMLCGQVGIAGSAKIGAFSVFGGQAAMSDGIEIGDGCQVAGGCVITSSWPDKSVLGGHPARPLREWLKGLAFVRNNSLKK